jgi:transcriptional regulator of acetoin/glycerol metabolism
MIALDTETPAKVDIRLVSAAHSIEENVRRGAFREDLSTGSRVSC